MTIAIGIALVLLVLLVATLGHLQAQEAHHQRQATLARLDELIRLETLKQTQRASGRDLLRERLKERIAQAAATRAQK